MAYNVHILARVRKYLKTLDKATQKRIRNKIADIAQHPQSHVGAKKMSGYNDEVYWRYRVGNYRIICQIQDNELLVIVLKIGNRRDVYDKFKRSF